MARGSSQATGAATAAQNLSNTNSGNANALFGVLEPQLAAESANPQGYAPAALAGMKSEAMQGAGGTQAAAVGQGALRAARTRNAGGADAATAASARGAGQQLSNANLKVDAGNEELKQQQRQSGLSGMEGLFGTSTGAGVGALGQVASNVSANTGAANESYDWAKDILSPLLSWAGKV
jgi:hypothetical protein